MGHHNQVPLSCEKRAAFVRQDTIVDLQEWVAFLFVALLNILADPVTIIIIPDVHFSDTQMGNSIICLALTNL